MSHYFFQCSVPGSYCQSIAPGMKLIYHPELVKISYVFVGKVHAEVEANNRLGRGSGKTGKLLCRGS